ncbi:endonuclease/exonuclease/phosphatase family protein [Pleurocapsales cyanobacterium LEGE 10410]|nr:endonuclease/exonuclease/phosphatase family protein [Pleurocapsales cyanobacterium LEGE 10410]
MFTKKLNGLAYHLFVCLCILATASSLAGYWGEFNLYLEFASGYKLQFLLMALCSLVYFVLARRKFWLFVSLFCVLINFGEILPWYFNRPKITNVELYQPLKVLSYNVFWKNEYYDRAIALIGREQPDIAVFQEAIPHWNLGLASLKTNFPYHIRAEKLEIEVYSKLPLRNPEIKLYGTYRGLVIVEIKVGDRLVKLAATHAYPQLYWGKGGWQIRNRHLKYGIGEYAQNIQQPLIVIGDLNVSMWSPFYHSMIESSGLHNARQGFGILPTHSIIAPQFASLSAPIDHCLVSSEIQVKNFRLGEAIGSDHLPIIAELLIPQSSN